MHGQRWLTNATKLSRGVQCPARLVRYGWHLDIITDMATAGRTKRPLAKPLLQMSQVTTVTTPGTPGIHPAHFLLTARTVENNIYYHGHYKISLRGGYMEFVRSVPFVKFSLKIQTMKQP